jgi:hypothetical protein
LLDTAEKNGGLCMPCKGGYRKNIEASKQYYAREKKERENPARKHWMWLVSQVHQSETGFSGLSPQNQRFFAACLLEGEIYNGGFDQYFSNSSADYFSYAIEGLTEMGAIESCRLLVQAKELYFGQGPVPATQASRIDYLRATADREDERSRKVDEIDQMFWKNPDNFQECAAKYAEKYELHSGF